MVKKFNYSDIIKNEVHKYIGYKSKEPLNYLVERKRKKLNWFVELKCINLKIKR